VTAGELPDGMPWEVAASLAGVLAGGAAAVALQRDGRLPSPAGATAGAQQAADWFRLPALTRAVVVAPTLALARAAARFDDEVIDAVVRGVAVSGRRAAGLLGRGDDRVVDAGVRGIAVLTAWSARVLDRVAEIGVDGAVEGVARLIGVAGHDSRRLQTGQAHHYYALVATATVVLVIVTALWS